ncbi:MAG TPA: hypothetical protein VGT60_05050 [Candidatus Limnocylindria bacterium]|nr:hypothetical protein [Candidatus Limnocylindria bacterium]
MPPEQDRRRASSPVDTTWRPTLAYAIGLMATDGCVADGDHISFPSADRELVELFAACLGKRNAISEYRTETGGTAYRIQFGDVAFCRWLAGIGITGRKSLSIGAITVPAEQLLPLARGLLDGDGSIINKRARADTHGRKDYYWEYLQTKFVCASRPHLEWLKAGLKNSLGVDGLIITRSARNGKNACYTLRYGKRDSHILLSALYRDPHAPRLTRKWTVWQRYLDRHPDIRATTN